jgi:PTS system ascorbate-specific IIA component
VLLGELLDSKRVRFAEKAETWEDAIRMSCELLLEEGGYVDEIIAAVSEMGPYMVLMPGFALPHAVKGSKNAHGTAISFMKLSESVQFHPDNRDKDACVFFTMVARDTEEHLKNMRKLWKMLTNEELCEDLLKVSSEEELLALDKKYS